CDKKFVFTAAKRFVEVVRGELRIAELVVEPLFMRCCCLAHLLPRLVVSPERFGFLDVCCLCRLVAAAEQDDDLLAVVAKVNSVARSEIDLQFLHTRSNVVRMTGAAQAYPIDPIGNRSLDLRIPQRDHPLAKRKRSVRSPVM